MHALWEEKKNDRKNEALCAAGSLTYSNVNEHTPPPPQHTADERTRWNLPRKWQVSVPNEMPVDLQSFSEAIYEGLEEGFIVGNGLEDVSISRHVADGPLTQPCTAQTEDVTGKKTYEK